MAIFNYTKIHDVYKQRGAALPGQITTDAGVITVAAIANEVLYPGQAVELYEDNGVTKAKNATTAAKFSGIVLEDIHAQVGVQNLKHQFINEVKAGQEVTVMRHGYVWVPIENATPTIARNGSVYIRTVAGSGKVVGGLATAADSSNNAALTGIKLTGQAGFPLTGEQNGTTATAITGRTAEVKVELGLY